MRLSAKSRLVSQPPLARVLALGAFLFCGGLLLVAAQKSTQKEKGATAPSTATLLTRSAARHETHRLGYGGTLTVVGAPRGAIVIEGWPRSEIDVTSEIQWQAETEADLDRLAAVNTVCNGPIGIFLRPISSSTSLVLITACTTRLSCDASPGISPNGY